MLLGVIPEELSVSPSISFQGQPISLEGVEEAITALGRLKSASEDVILTDHSLEHVVDDSRRIPDSYRKDLMVGEDGGPEKYRLGGASDVFLLNALVQFDEIDASEARSRLSRRITYDRSWREGIAGDRQFSWADLVRLAVSSPQTVSVITDGPRTQSQLDGLFESFIFHVSYNSGRPLLPRNNSSTSNHGNHARRLHRRLMADIDVPRRKYAPELVYHYQLGLSSDSPVLAFLSFYHVLEHWYENVFLQDMTITLKDLITGPQFSFKRNDDLKKLIREVTRQAQIRNDEMVFSEEKALELTLRQYVKLSEVVTALELREPGLEEYFRKNRVPFSDGRTVNLGADDPALEYRALANRIYQTRNALVHSKDNGKKRFKPFKNDHDLWPESKLLQAVAEQVVINSSVSR